MSQKEFTIEALFKATGADQFAKDFDKATGHVKGFDTSTKKSTGGLKSFMGGVGKIAGAIGITKLVAAGFNAIKNSVGDAVTRVDTLNQFPKMMEAIGFSTNESEAAINKLSDGIQGLPTRLDEVAASAQQIAIMTGDLEGATDTTLALNNAFLASGSSSADAERGLTQYVQMLSKGEVDMQSWRTLQETMGVALNDTAKAFGFAGESAQNDLYAALQDGSITFDEFNDKIIELDQGVGGFAERALIGSEGIATSMQNIKTAIATGIANSIQTVNDAMEANGFGSISENLDKVKVAVQKSFVVINEAVAKGIEIIVLLVAKWEEVKEVGKSMMDLLIPEFGLLTDAVMRVWETIKESFSTGNFEEVASGFSEMISLIIDEITFGFPFLLEAGLEIITNIITGITTKIPELSAKGHEMTTMFYTILADFVPKLLVMGMKFVVSLLKGIGNKMPEWIRSAVDMVVKMASTIGDNLPKILAKGVEMLGSLAKGFRNNFPAIVEAAFEMIAKLLGSILENLPRLIAAGVELIAKLALGLIKAIPRVLRAMADIARGITGAVDNISLAGAGRAIIRGFINGMKAVWETGKKWVKGIGTWIKDNKGPISYDRRLLRPAGDAIISGLNKGLQDSFPDVQRTVSGMAGAIQKSLTASPTMDIAGNIAKSNAQVKSAVTHEINNSSVKQPAYITLQLGKRSYRAFVNDITNFQDNETGTELSFSL